MCDQPGKNPLKYSAVAGNWTQAMGRTDSKLSHWAIMTDGLICSYHFCLLQKTIAIAPVVAQATFSAGYYGQAWCRLYCRGRVWSVQCPCSYITHRMVSTKLSTSNCQHPTVSTQLSAQEIYTHSTYASTRNHVQLPKLFEEFLNQNAVLNVFFFVCQSFH